MNNIALRLAATVAFVALAPSCDEEAIEHPPESASSLDQFPEQVATAYCATLFACGGSSSCVYSIPLPYSTEAECVAHEQTQLEQMRSNAMAAGMIYDPTCAEQIVATYEAIGCQSFRQVAWEAPDLMGPTGMACQPFYVEIPADSGTCITIAGTGLNNCEPGKHCADDRCHDAGDIAPCNDGLCPEGTRCTEQASAAWGSGNNGMCTEIVAEGEPCSGPDTFFYCEAGTYCPRSSEDGVADPVVCVPKLVAGEACTWSEECLSYLCEEGQCTTPPTILCDYPPERWRR
ncbi:MAG: hypothetical protein AAF799_45190 [Myxococcota bacterium]